MKSNFLYFVCVTCLLVFTISAPAQVIISEFMADNKKTFADEDGAVSGLDRALQYQCRHSEPRRLGPYG